MKPYIGVTGFTNVVQVCHAFSAMFDDRYDGSYKLMIGVLASRSSLYGGYKKARMARMQDLPDLFLNHPEVLNLIHFSTHNKSELSNDLTRLKEISGPNLSGFQLNIKWPDPNQILSYRKTTPNGWDDTIVLQIGAGALTEIGEDPIKLVEVLKDNYSELVDYILLDESGGTGQDIRFAKMYGYLDALYEMTTKDDFMIGVAGGLSWKSFNGHGSFLTGYESLSIDAENKLINQKTDQLIPYEARHYIEAGKSCLCNPRRRKGKARATHI